MILRILIPSIIVAGILAQGLPECPEIECLEPCKYGFKKDYKGCRTCDCLAQECAEITCAIGTICEPFTLSGRPSEKIGQCVDPTFPIGCQQPMDIGPCKAASPKWYYDSDEQVCEEFTYGGCQGNENRFDTMADCQHTCKKTLINEGAPSCPVATCFMYCEHDFKVDDKGCNICECREQAPDLDHDKGLDPSIFKVAAGCEENNEISCDLICPHGFQRDASGCHICKCLPPPDCGLAPRCSDACQYGYHDDEQGCPTCDCRQKGECSKKDCHMHCPFGRKMDAYDCPMCACAENPCHFVDCPPDTICKVFNNMQPKCVTGPSEWVSGCSSVMCAMYCEHGFMSDKYGCDVCKCHTEKKPECPMRKCVPCNYGYVYDKFGCRTCECLSDPCLNKTCLVNTQVCSLQHQGPGVPVRAKCIDSASVQTIVVRVIYVHDAMKKLDLGAFTREFRRHLLQILKVTEANLASMRVKERNHTRMSIAFHLVEEGSLKNVLPVYDALKSMPASQASFKYGNNTFRPEPQTYHGEYYALKTPPGGDTGETKDGASTYIVIGCVAGGAVALLAGVIIAAVIVKSKSNSTGRRKRNIIYRPADSADSDQATFVSKA